ncbi:MAG TPA: NAD-dependent deacylase [Bacteroidia bacterium]|jgi:NAD-dependent deacetylase|nr:NAD-dependent deacylase [Bacteroidia bacterium]
MSSRKKIIVFTGAGMSAESGIKTFRDSGGMWEEFKIEDVATPEAWVRNQELVLDFYNQRRKQVMEAQPNEGHKILAGLEKYFDVQIITQNIDDLHERAGSKKVLHLHGEIMKARSSTDPELIYLLRKAEIKKGDKCEKGSQLRPHIVWFGEMVPEMDNAIDLAAQAEIFITVGTSLVVYPAAGLIHYAPEKSLKYLVDPGNFESTQVTGLKHFRQKASEGLRLLQKELLSL